MDAPPGVLAWVAYLAVPIALWSYGRRAGPLRPTFGLVALSVAAGGAAHALGVVAAAGGDWVRWPAGVAAAAIVAVPAVAAVRLLRRHPAADTADRQEWEHLRRLEAAVAASGDGVMIAEAVGGPAGGLRIVFTNPAFERMTGYSDREALGQSPSLLPDGEAEPGALTAVRRALRGTDPLRLEVPSRRKDGTRLWAEWQVVPVTSSGTTSWYTNNPPGNRPPRGARRRSSPNS